MGSVAPNWRAAVSHLAGSNNFFLNRFIFFFYPFSGKFQTSNINQKRTITLAPIENVPILAWSLLASLRILTLARAIMLLRNFRYVTNLYAAFSDTSQCGRTWCTQIFPFLFQKYQIWNRTVANAILHAIGPAILLNTVFVELPIEGPLLGHA